VLSALIGLPAFFVGGVPSWVTVLVAIFLVLTLLGCVLVAPGLRRVPTKAV
jgi:membrane protein implicated in regulation of membrane protease activity